jgi:putative nucleotidyltransferase with HDIG domain
MIMSSDDSIQVEQIINRLPAMPHVVQHALAAIDKEDVTQVVVAKILSQDQVLVAQLLGLANSPFFGLAGAVLSIQEACVVLGMNTLRSTLIATGAMRVFPITKKRIYNREVLWHHALCVAGITRFIALRLRLDEGSAFTAGLLHDIGKMAFDECCANALPAMLQYQKEHDCYEFEAEQAVLGMTHSALGAKLAQHWKLPAIVVAAIADHHTTVTQSERARLVDIVNLGDLLFHALQLRNQDNILLPPLATGCLTRLGLDWSRIREWLVEIDAIVSRCNATLLET